MGQIPLEFPSPTKRGNESSKGSGGVGCIEVTMDVVVPPTA